MVEDFLQVLSWRDGQRRHWTVVFDADVTGGKVTHKGVRLQGLEGQRLTPAVVQAFANDFTEIVAHDLELRADFRPRILNKPTTRPGPKPKRSLLEIAKVWLDAQAKGESPGQAVATKYGVTAGRASQLVKQARDAGLIPPRERMQ